MPDQDFNLGSGFADAIGSFNDYQNGRIGRAAKEQSDAQNTSVVHNVTDGTVQVNMPADVFKEKAEAAAKYDQISAIYMKQVQELEAQRAQIKAHPFANTLAQIAGSMAANDVNPITRGLGQAALRLNPQDAELQAREQIPLRGALETAEAKTRAAQTSIARMDAQQRLAETERHNKETEWEKREKDLDTRTIAALKNARLSIQKTRQPLSPEAFNSEMRSWGITDPEKIKEAYVAHREQAQQLDDAFKQEQQAKKEIVAERGKEARKTAAETSRLRYENAIAAQDHRLENKKVYDEWKVGLKEDEGLKIVTPKNLDKLAGLRETDRYLDDLEDLLKRPEIRKKAGFFKAGNIAPIFAKDEDRIKFENLLAHETPRVLQIALRGGQGGASILRSEEGRKFVKELGAIKTMTPGQIASVISNIRMVTSNERRSTMDETPRARWQDRPDLLGPDKDYRPKGWIPDQGSQAGAPSFDDYQKWKSGANR